MYYSEEYFHLESLRALHDRAATGRRHARAPSATHGPSGSSRNLNGLSFQWKKQCHNFCGWLPNVVPLLRQIALLNYVLQNILCKRPREEKKLFYSPQQPKVQIIWEGHKKSFNNYVDIILTTRYCTSSLFRSFKQDQKRSRKAKKDFGKAKDDLARPKTISARPKTISQGQKRSRSTNPLLRSFKWK